nr:hypothetical protein BaRGS_017809 [Batillaria attramentaria]
MTPAMSEELSAWWRRRMACTTDPAMSDDVYLDIVSRFVGPATSVSVHCVVPPRVEVRTEGEAVSEVGERMARVVLTPHQFGLASRPQRMVCLTGPPGTGKTLLLVLKGLRWLRQGHDVHVVSWYFGTLAASRLIYHMLQMSLKDDPSNSTTGYLHFHQYDIDIHEEDVETAVKELTDAATTCKEEKGEEKLFVLIDEAKFSYGP